MRITKGLDSNNKGGLPTVVDKSYLRQIQMTSKGKTIALYRLSEIQTWEFRALQLLDEVEMEMMKHRAFISLLSLGVQHA